MKTCSAVAVKMLLSTRLHLLWNCLTSGSRNLFVVFFVASSRQVTWRHRTFPDHSWDVCAAWALFQIDERVTRELFFSSTSAAREKRQGIKGRVSTLCLDQLRRPRAPWIGEEPPRPSHHLSCLPKTIIHFRPLNISQRGGSPSEPSCWRLSGIPKCLSQPRWAEFWPGPNTVAQPKGFVTIRWIVSQRDNGHYVLRAW